MCSYLINESNGHSLKGRVFEDMPITTYWKSLFEENLIWAAVPDFTLLILLYVCDNVTSLSCILTYLLSMLLVLSFDVSAPICIIMFCRLLIMTEKIPIYYPIITNVTFSNLFFMHVVDDVLFTSVVLFK